MASDGGGGGFFEEAGSIGSLKFALEGMLRENSVGRSGTFGGWRIMGCVLVGTLSSSAHFKAREMGHLTHSLAAFWTAAWTKKLNNVYSETFCIFPCPKTRTSAPFSRSSEKARDRVRGGWNSSRVVNKS